MKPYPAYKDSGVEWLGEIPVGWEVKRLGYFFIQRKEKVSDKDFAPLSVTKNGVVPQLETAAKTDHGDNRKRVCVGDFVINGRSDRKGSSGLSTLSGSVSLINIVLKPRNINADFTNHLLRNHLFQEEFYRHGKGIVADLWSTNYSEMRNIVLAIPPLPEQRAIAAFLDYKTRLIDTYMTKKQQQIERLQAYRTALINQAVTKGLNPDAPMKDSGIEWLGEIPAHWGTPHLKFLCSLLKDGTHQPPKRQETGIPLLSVRNIVNGRFINLPDDSLISVDDYEKLKRAFEVKENDVLLAIVGATLGKVAIVQEMSSFVIQRSLAIFRPIPSLLHFKYLAYFFKTSLFQQLLWQNVGFSAQPGIYLGTLGNFHCVLPPVKEQHAIDVYLDEQTAKIDTLIATTQHQIERLQAYRTSLISDAVTGKIDVREAVCGIE